MVTQTVEQAQQRGERRWALGVAAFAVALTMLSYLFGLLLAGARPALSWYSWLGYNLDDSCVYLAWMRQAADGHFFQHNLFTTAPQIGHQFNLFFLVLGWIAALTHLPLLAIYHGARLLFGVALLRAVWWLIELLVEDARARRAAFLVVCFSAGLGWVLPQWWRIGASSPVDVWQPEAITWLCLYLNPLFVVSLLLMVGVIGWLVVGERNGSWKPALWAGLCGLLLGNIHTYDVITLGAIWGAFLLIRTAVTRRFDAGSWGRALLAGALTAISTIYMAYLVKTEAVFAQRVAVPTLSPPFLLYVLGYGLLLPLALLGAWVLWSRRSGEPAPEGRGRSLLLLLPTWAVANLAIAYLPVSFQRKMLMGEHLPLAILAGVALAWLLRAVRGRSWTLALGSTVLLLSLTNGRFAWRDMQNFMEDRAQTRMQRPYMYAGEIDALRWVREHVPPDQAIQPLPWLAADPDGRVGFFDITVASFTPPLTGHPVNAGHWGETPDFKDTMGQWQRFLYPTTPDTWRRDLLRQTGVRYVIFTQKHNETPDPAAEERLLSTFRHSPPSYLRLIPEASNEDADVYEVANL